jgi:hypothetical protein
MQHMQRTQDFDGRRMRPVIADARTVGVEIDGRFGGRADRPRN